jgi:hypothetical protein
MPAARAHSPGSGNGSHRWLRELIVQIKQITPNLQDLTKRIRSQPEPTVSDVAKAHDVVMRLVLVIEEQVHPRRWELIQLASASGSPRGLDAALDRLVQSGQDALSAIEVYKQTLDREHQQRRSERRSNTRYSSDQKTLQRLRQEAAVATSNLIRESVAFAGAMPP